MNSTVKQVESSWKVAGDIDWTIHIPKELYDKIFCYVQNIDNEIAGFGDVEVDKANKCFRITRLRMYKQKVGGATADQDSKFLGDVIEQAILSNEDLSKTKFEWHSHVNMGVFWSGTDEECCKTLLNASGDFYIFFVVNKKYELLARVDYLMRVGGQVIQVTHNAMPVVVESVEDASMLSEVKKDIAELVEVSTSIQTSHYVKKDDDDYYATVPCELCGSSQHPTRYDFELKTYICKICSDIEDKKSSGKNVGYPCLSTCDICKEKKQLRFNRLWERWVCEECDNADTTRVDEPVPQHYKDSKGRNWHLGECDQCSQNGIVYEEKQYVTWVKKAKKNLCDDCYEEWVQDNYKSVKGV